MAIQVLKHWISSWRFRMTSIEDNFNCILFEVFYAKVHWSGTSLRFISAQIKFGELKNVCWVFSRNAFFSCFLLGKISLVTVLRALRISNVISEKLRSYAKIRTMAIFNFQLFNFCFTFSRKKTSLKKAGLCNLCNGWRLLLLMIKFKTMILSFFCQNIR